MARIMVYSLVALIIAPLALVVGGSHLARTLAAFLRPSFASPRAAVPALNGPLLVVDQQGDRSGQVQIGAGHDEILALQDGAIRVVAQGLTATCCSLGGLAPSPRGRYIAFSQEPKGLDKPPTEGLWLVSTNGAGLRRLLFPPPAARLHNPDLYGEALSIAPVAWSPDRYTLAYAVDLFTDTPINPDFAHDAGIWLTRYDGGTPHQVFNLVSLATAAPRLNALCRGAVPTIEGLSWRPDGRTVVASANCILPIGPFVDVQMIVSVDTLTGKGAVLVTPGRDAAVAPTTGRLTYVTGSLDIQGRGRTTLWVADAQGQHAHPLVTGQGVQGLIGSPTWSPDGRSIAYIGGQKVFKNTTSTISVVDIATGRSRTVQASNAPGLPAGGYFVRLAWMHTLL